MIVGLAAVCAGLQPGHVLADIPRVEKIRRRVRPKLVAQYDAAGLSYPPKRVLLRVFKWERQVELWVAPDAKTEMTKLETFEICAASGSLGPKRQYGDEQVPEGVYSIHRYNGWSGFHMSLRVDYPNASDRVRGRRGALGGAIMVHGGCASIGCVAIENGPIERVFLTALDANRAGRKRPAIHMLPTRFDEEGWARLHAHAERVGGTEQTRLLTLWQELSRVDEAFHATHLIPEVRIDAKTGAYELVEAESPARG
ncbi:MAG: hypothetical protein AAF721_24870 [Myxococcota bacterium]